MKEYSDTQSMIAEATALKNEFDLAKKEKQLWDEKFDREEQIYMGDREFGNIYSNQSRNDARTVVRMSQTVIESQIDLSIPDAVFKPVAKDDERAVRKLQAEVDYILRSGNMDEINTLAEREVKKYGIVAYKVLRDAHKKTQVICIHPKNILWAAGATDKNKCRCWYHVENETLQECKKRYGKAADALPQLGERADVNYDEVGTKYESNVNKTNDVNLSPDVFSRAAEDPLAKYVVIEKWYLDDDDEAGVIAFSNECILWKVPKFYHGRKVDPETEEYEYDKDGEEVLVDEDELIVPYNERIEEENEAGEKVVVEQPKIEAGAKLPRYHPKGPDSIPIVIQNNIPRSKAIPGISDIERTYDFEQSMKKMIHKHEERILKGNTKILYNKQQEEEAAQLLDTDELNIIPVMDVNNFKDFEAKDRGREAIEFYDFLKQDLQYQLGITQAWQGMTQGEAKSGKAIQSLVNQTAEKISIKVNEKNIAYKRIYRLLCNFVLCFSDGDMAYRLDNTLETEYGTFNKYDMLRKDDSGNWLYPDFDIEISAEQGFPKTKTAMMEMLLNLAGGGYFEATPRNLLVWQTLAKLGFPQAESILQAIQTELDRQMQLEQQQMEMQQQQTQADVTAKTGVAPDGKPTMEKIVEMLPKDIREAFLALPPEQQQELMGGRNV